MWIAKPLELCRDEELAHYRKMQEMLQISGSDLPLSQSLSWANAAQVSGKKTWAIFNQEELIGGIVFVVQDTEQTIVECINGPCLRDSQSIATAYARFVNVISKAIKGINTIILRPRTSVQLPVDFPFPIEEEQKTATWTIDLKTNCPWPPVTKRMARTIRSSSSNIIDQKITSIDHSKLRTFYKGQEAFYHLKDLPIPPWEWWKALVFPEREVMADITFWIEETILSSDNLQSQTHLLLADYGGKRTYLFGHEGRDEHFPSKLSSQALAHVHAMTHAREMAIHTYDFNGYHPETSNDDPYLGVNQFKEQFLGSIRPYHIPTLTFEI